MKDSKYIDNVILKLKRRYSKDELVSSMTKKQSQLELENGILTSEKDELQYKINKILKLDDNVKARFCQTQYVRNLKVEIKSLREKCRKMSIENEKLLMKLINENK